MRSDLAGQRATNCRDVATFGSDQARSALLRALHDRAGDAIFSSAELVIDAGRAGNEILQAAIIRACGDTNPRHVGKLMRAIEGVEYDGLQIRRLGVDRLGVIWQCMPTVKV